MHPVQQGHLLQPSVDMGGAAGGLSTVRICCEMKARVCISIVAFIAVFLKV
jgi:hypothetical protein